MNIENKTQFKKKDLKTIQNQLGLIFKTYDPGHEAETNPIEDKYEKKISIKQILNDEIEKKRPKTKET